MKKKYLYCLMVLWAWSLSVPMLAQQPTFEFLLEYSTRKWSANAVEDDEGNIITIVSERTGVEYAPSEIIKAYTLKFSSNGDTLTRHYSLGDTIFNFASIGKLSDDRFLICGWSKIENTNEMYLLLMEIDKDLNPVWRKQHSFVGNFLISMIKLFIFDNKYILLGDLMETTSGLKPIFITIDKTGNLMDYILINSFHMYYNSYLLSPDSSNIWVFSHGLNPINGMGLHVFDTTFNYKYGKAFHNFTGGMEQVKWHGPTGFIMNYQARRPGAPYQDDEVYLSKYDTALNRLYYNYFGALDTNDVVPLLLSHFDFNHPDSIYFGGLKNNDWGYPSPDTKSWIMVGQTDSLFQPRFIHYIGGNKYYRTYHIIATNDGGCFICAGVWKTEEQIYDLLFLKLNNEGLLVGSSPPGMVIKKALIYPNPVQNVLHVETALRDVTLQIIDTQGRPVHSEKLNGKNLTIDVSGFRPGTYVYIISNWDGEIEQGKFIKN